MNATNQVGSITTPAESTQAVAQTITPNQNDTIYNSVSPANEAAGNSVDASNGADNQLTNNLADNTYMSAALPPNVAGNESASSPTVEELLAEIDRLNAFKSNQHINASDEVSTPAAGATVQNTTFNTTESEENNADASNGDQPATPSQNNSQAAHAPTQHETSVLSNSAIPSLIPSDTDPQQIVELKAAIVVALVNPEFVKDIKRIEKVKETLKMPDEEARVRAQLKSHAEKKLRSDAAIEAETTGVYTAPTLAEIEARIEIGVKAWRFKNKK